MGFVVFIKIFKAREVDLKRLLFRKPTNGVGIKLVDPLFYNQLGNQPNADTTLFLIFYLWSMVLARL